MIATLIQVSVMRSRDWHVDVRLLSFAREGAQIRGLLVLKTGWAGFDMDRTPQRRLYGNLLWRFRFDLPLARPDREVIAYRQEITGEITDVMRKPRPRGVIARFLRRIVSIATDPTWDGTAIVSRKQLDRAALAEWRRQMLAWEIAEYDARERREKERDAEMEQQKPTE